MSIDTFLIQLFLMFPNVLCKAVPHPCAVPKLSQEALTSAAQGRCGRGWGHQSLLKELKITYFMWLDKNSTL